MTDASADAFASVVGLRRGTCRKTERVPTDLDRARALLPLIGAALGTQDIVGSVIALRRQAHQLGVDVVHGVFAGAEEWDDELALTLLLSVTGELIGVVELDPEGQPLLLRPDQPLWPR